MDQDNIWYLFKNQIGQFFDNLLLSICCGFVMCSNYTCVISDFHVRGNMGRHTNEHIRKVYITSKFITSCAEVDVIAIAFTVGTLSQSGVAYTLVNGVFPILY